MPDYSRLLSNDTIAAIATPVGGAIAIVRLSGGWAHTLLSQVFTKAPPYEGHRAYYGKLLDIDEVLVTTFVAPRSYTAEDMVEISCHGSPYIAERILQELISLGARLAEPGEFSKRAFLNGRMDLSQAEAVMHIVSARGAAAHKAALSQLGGGLGKEVRGVIDGLSDVLAKVEVAIDYPEHEEADIAPAALLPAIDGIISRITKLNNPQGRYIRDGVRAVIAGRPNAGKSSLLNAMLGYQRAIVTPTAGTTRDVIAEPLNIGPLHLELVDTAGIRKGGDEIEDIGIALAHKELERADLVLYIIDGSAPQSPPMSFDKKTITIINKIDLPQQSNHTGIAVSAKTGQGLDALYQSISDMFKADTSLSQNFATNVRHTELLTKATTCLKQAAAAITDGQPIDIAAIDLQEANELLSEIIGQNATDELLNKIFSSFCLGK